MKVFFYILAVHGKSQYGVPRGANANEGRHLYAKKKNPKKQTDQRDKLR